MEFCRKKLEVDMSVTTENHSLSSIMTETSALIRLTFIFYVDFKLMEKSNAPKKMFVLIIVFCVIIMKNKLGK